MPIRFEKKLMDILDEGARRTPHKKQELVRITLRRHLRQVVEEEAARPTERITNIEPYSRGELAAAYKAVAKERWDKIEDAAIRAQGKPSFED